MPLERAGVELVIDTDTAADDAIAIMLAAFDPNAEIVAVTTVAGNVPVETATRNARWVLDRYDLADVPVHPGASSPLVRPLITGQDVHGESGMGRAEPPHPPAPAADPTAAAELVRLAREHEGRLTLVTLGPLTNIATAVLLDPAFLTRFRRVVSMAGAADGHGNVSDVAEYNMWADPEAAHIVLSADGEVELLGWDASRQAAVIGSEESGAIDALGTETGEFVLALVSELDRYCREVQGLRGFDLPDPLAMTVALDPTIVTGAEDRPVRVALGDESRGQLMIDRRTSKAAARGRLLREISRERFLAMLYAMCTGATLVGGRP
jgi:purine nucleosidase